MTVTLLRSLKQLFIFGGIIVLIICIRPNSQDRYSVQPYNEPIPVLQSIRGGGHIKYIAQHVSGWHYTRDGHWGKAWPAGRMWPSDSFCAARQQQEKTFNVQPFLKS